MTTPEVKHDEVVSEPQSHPPDQEPSQEIVAVEEKGVSQTPTQIAAQIAADQAQQQPQVATPAPAITITIPATTQQLDDWSKGSPDNALTWLAFYWIRMIKKALLHGWGVMSSVANPPALFVF